MLPGHIDDPEFLFNGRWRPITETVLYANAPAKRVVDELLNGVRGKRIIELTGHPLAVKELPHGSLPERFHELLPLDAVEPRRLLIVATANPEWSAIFGSRWAGLGGQSHLAWLANGGIESVLIDEAPHRPKAAPPNKSYGIRKMESYEIVPGEHHLAHPHTIVVRAKGNSSWEASAGPDNPFPVGLAWNPGARRTQDCFTHEHLAEMARRYGLRPFDDDFYPDGGDAFLVYRTDPDEHAAKKMSMAQARGLEPRPAAFNY